MGLLSNVVYHRRQAPDFKWKTEKGKKKIVSGSSFISLAILCARFITISCLGTQAIRSAWRMTIKSCENSEIAIRSKNRRSTTRKNGVLNLIRYYLQKVCICHRVWEWRTEVLETKQNIVTWSLIRWMSFENQWNSSWEPHNGLRHILNTRD